MDVFELRLIPFVHYLHWIEFLSWGYPCGVWLDLGGASV